MTDDIDGEAVESEPTERSESLAQLPSNRHGLRLALTVGVLTVVALGALAGWLGFRANDSHQREQQRAAFLAAGRQGALNLTTISYTEVDADIKRILDSATGAFYNDFQQRSQPFVDVVKQAQSTSQGTITESGLEAVHGDTAEALISVAVTTSNAGAAKQEPRAWRMRISMQKVGDTTKVSNVQFVP
ncbi:mammalian cell entry protein [Mycobacterium sp. AZCC_0083]|uniref:mammalian cell entry protein n=1 Tax=Mycobacterium sp. AZCC_0083 TaxID=2735882 RepID=UPI00182489D5|nr:mammalian cell entry protein [Mycobacterium sp. AZCC_0083]MBB5167860.1 Mce-associated membrane protein [Mycobacterium sp. AZCC_0083]